MSSRPSTACRRCRGGALPHGADRPPRKAEPRNRTSPSGWRAWTQGHSPVTAAAPGCPAHAEDRTGCWPPHRLLAPHPCSPARQATAARALVPVPPSLGRRLSTSCVRRLHAGYRGPVDAAGRPPVLRGRSRQQARTIVSGSVSAASEGRAGGGRGRGEPGGRQTGGLGARPQQLCASVSVSVRRGDSSAPSQLR